MIRCILSIGTMLSALGLVAVARAADEHKPDEAGIKDAVSVLVPTKGNTVEGTIVFKQLKDGVKVTGSVTGLTPGEHGFHIHMFGDLRAPDGTSAGGHYNPNGHQHGKPDAEERHEGDLGNITAAANGTAKVNVKAMGVKLHHILGRGVVVHAAPDDFSQPVGNAGARVAVGVIGLAEVKAPAASAAKK